MSTTSGSVARSGLLARFYRRSHGDESGMALVLVVGSMLVLAMLALTALAYTIQSQKFARYSQDYNAAMTAAQSGIEDYVSRLNRDDAYASSVDCANLALKGPMLPSTNTCGWTTTTTVGWLPVVAGETDPLAAHVHYSVDATKRGSEGTIIVTSTGRVNGEYRTIEGAVGKDGSTDYVYYTDFEAGDPANIQLYYQGNPFGFAAKPTGGASQDACGASGYEPALYWYEGRSSSDCAEITFGPSDTLDGAVFTNDAAWSNDATFLKGYLSANPGCNSVTATLSTWKLCLRNSGGSSSTANFNARRPAYQKPLYLDDTSAAFAAFPGCHYYGATRVIFNAAGTMTVWNKTVNNGGQAPTVISGPNGTPTCGDLATLNDPNGATLPVPNQMVVYVAAAPASATRVQCNAEEIGGPSGRALPLGTYDRATHKTSGSTHPDYTYDTNMAETTKYCQEGNLYAEGVLDGRVSLAAAQSIIVTGDLVLAGGRVGGNDILGLVATNSVEVFHPRSSTYRWQYTNASCTVVGSGGSYKYCPYGTVSEVGGWPKRYADPTTGSNNPSTGLGIAGSIQTLQHSFLVQKYSVGGSKGTLNVYGSIAQRWRGAVGTSSGEGYSKLYQYDPNLAFGPPPYFPSWTNSQWALEYSGEIMNPAVVKVP